MDADIEKKINTFFSQFNPRYCKKGEILIRAGEQPGGVFYLKNGIVKQYAISQKGEELTVNLFKPGVFFPMSWAINNTPNDFFYEAAENLEVYVGIRSRVIPFIKDNPDVLYDLMSRVYIGTDGLLARMTYLMSSSAYFRLVGELIIYAKRFGKYSGEELMLNISEKDLAALSGMTRETISREIKLLRSKDIIDFHQNMMVVKSLKLLENEINAGV